MSTGIDRSLLDQLVLSVRSLRSGKYSDFQIRCSDDNIIQAHRAVVCPRSRVLAAAIDGQFQEAVSQEIHLKDDEPSIVAKMMDFLYTLDYDDHRSPIKGPGDERRHDPASLVVNAKVYIVADKYELDDLKKLACTKYKQLLPGGTWNSSDFTESARLVYDNTMETDRMLRDIIVQSAGINVKALLDRGEFVELLKDHGDLATEIIGKVVARYESQVKDLETGKIVYDFGGTGVFARNNGPVKR